MNNEKYLVVVSGPSGCGKDTVVEEMRRINPALELSVSCTTRPRRADEIEGVDYYYIDREQFLTRVENGRMLEYTEYSDNLYGTPCDEVEARMNKKQTVLLVIDVFGGASVKKLYPGALLIFLKPPSMRELRRRLEKRGTESPAQIRSRLAIARRELRKSKDYDRVVVNDVVSVCARQIIEIINDWQENQI